MARRMGFNGEGRIHGSFILSLPCWSHSITQIVDLQIFFLFSLFWMGERLRWHEKDNAVLADPDGVIVGHVRH